MRVPSRLRRYPSTPGRRFHRLAGLSAAALVLAACSSGTSGSPSTSGPSSGTDAVSSAAVTTPTATVAVPDLTGSGQPTVTVTSTSTPPPASSDAPADSTTPDPTTLVPSAPEDTPTEESTPAESTTTPEPPSTSAAPTAPTSAAPTSEGATAGKVVVIDPGHNGANGANPDVINELVDAGFGQTKPCNTTGTSTDDGYSEARFNWQVALLVRAELENNGVTVIMTRDSNEGVGPCVDKRAAIGNDNEVDAVLSIHGDGSGEGDRGFYVMTAEVKPAGLEIAAASESLAVAVRDSLVDDGLSPANYLGEDGLWERADLAGLNLSQVPTVMVEMGNMRDSVDSALMTGDVGQQQIANGLADGVLDYLNQS